MSRLFGGGMTEAEMIAEAGASAAHRSRAGSRSCCRPDPIRSTSARHLSGSAARTRAGYMTGQHHPPTKQS